MSKKSWSNFELPSENMGSIEENERNVCRIHKIYRKDGDEMIKIYIFSSEPSKKAEQKKYPFCLSCDVIMIEKIYSRPNRWRRNNFFNLN